MTIAADPKPENPISITLAQPGEDVELKAIAYILSVLRALDPDSAVRVMRYLNVRFPAEARNG